VFFNSKNVSSRATTSLQQQQKHFNNTKKNNKKNLHSSVSVTLTGRWRQWIISGLDTMSTTSVIHQ